MTWSVPSPPAGSAVDGPRPGDAEDPRFLVVRGYAGTGLTNVTMSMEVAVVLAALSGRVLVPFDFGVDARGGTAPGGRAWSPFDLYDLPVPWLDDHLLDPTPPGSGHLGLTCGSLTGAVLATPASSTGAGAPTLTAFRNGRTADLLRTWSARARGAEVVVQDASSLSFVGYCVHLGPPGSPGRRWLIDLLGRVRPKAPYREGAARAAAALGPFNAVHLRRGDFTDIGFTPRARDVTGAEIAANLAGVLDPALPLVLLTDTDPGDPFLDPLRDAYDLRLADALLSDVRAVGDGTPTTGAPGAMMAQLLAVHARSFVGTLFSTFTGLIHRWRGVAHGHEEFMFTHDEFGSPDHPFVGCRYLEHADGPWSWNRAPLPVAPEALSWMREWPESFRA